MRSGRATFLFYDGNIIITPEKVILSFTIVTSLYSPGTAGKGGLKGFLVAMGGVFEVG